MTKPIKKDVIHAEGIDIGIYTRDYENEFISLTGIAKKREGEYPGYVIQNWMRKKIYCVNTPNKLYNTITEVEQRDFMRAFIARIDSYSEKSDNGCWIKNIVFNFPMPVQGREIKSLPLWMKCLPYAAR